jgi:hypothetical protein
LNAGAGPSLCLFVSRFGGTNSGIARFGTCAARGSSAVSGGLYPGGEARESLSDFFLFVRCGCQTLMLPAPGGGGGGGGFWLLAATESGNTSGSSAIAGGLCFLS